MDLGPGDLGNPADLRLQILPEAAHDLTSDGVASAVSDLQGRDDRIAATIALLQENPKATIARVFRVTSLQHGGLWQMSYSLLHSRLQPAVDALKAGQLTGWDVMIEPPEVEFPGGNQFMPVNDIMIGPVRISCSFTITAAIPP